MTVSNSVWLGVLFVLVGALNVWLVLQASARVKEAKASQGLIAAHRIGGYLFIALFCVMGYFMVARLGDATGSGPSTTIHLTLAMVLSPLLFIKVLVARYYKSHYSLLMPIGLVIFVLSFVLIGITAGPSLAHHARMQTVSLQAFDLPPAVIDIDLAAATMEKRCSKCHNLDRIVGSRKDARGWLVTVNRMKALPDSGISDEDSRIIASYLASQMSPKGTVAAASLEVARALVDQRCGRCHSLDRVYKIAQTPEEWSATVARMVSYAAGSPGAFQPGEDQQIIAYLSATQTSDAVQRRKAQLVAASSSGRNIETQPVPNIADQPPARHPFDGKLIAFISIVCLGMLTLIIRRPGKPSRTKSDLPAPARTIGITNPLPNGPHILRLANITQQAANAKTLRFIVAPGQKLNVRPGQFLTFSFLFDGKKIPRSYSICSAPTRSGYIEITPKRVSQGCASVFLNDRATVGLTVEANGPFGHFYFDENKHANVVLLAAGSGITPMLAMLRYMDDLCLDPPITLLYCVRTSDDIIFHDQLEELRARLKNFQYHLLLSQPHADWPGPRGHVNREFIEHTVPDLASPHFFLCGPPPFMDVSRTILMGLGVTPGRILQESFGSTVPKSVPEHAAAPTGVMVEFVRSGKACMLREGQTLLEAAEEQGIGMPSSCRQGQCGTCKTKLLEGDIHMEADDGLDPDSKAQGFVLTCVGRARSSVKLDA